VLYKLNPFIVCCNVHLYMIIIDGQSSKWAFIMNDFIVVKLTNLE